jgi:hypothetical protein
MLFVSMLFVSMRLVRNSLTHVHTYLPPPLPPALHLPTSSLHLPTSSLHLPTPFSFVVQLYPIPLLDNTTTLTLPTSVPTVNKGYTICTQPVVESYLLALYPGVRLNLVDRTEQVSGDHTCTAVLSGDHTCTAVLSGDHTCTAAVSGDHTCTAVVSGDHTCTAVVSDGCAVAGVSDGCAVAVDWPQHASPLGEHYGRTLWANTMGEHYGL